MSYLRPGMNDKQKATALGKDDRSAATICLTLGSVSSDYFELFDKFDIVGPAIYRLYATVCSESIHKTGLVLRACDIGLNGLTRDKLMHAINNRGAGVDVEAIVREMEKIADIINATKSLFRE